MSYAQLTDKRLTTRKPHKCDWCGEEITTGSNVRFIEGIFDGSFTRSLMHDECDAAASRSDIGEDGYMPFDNQRGVSWEEE